MPRLGRRQRPCSRRRVPLGEESAQAAAQARTPCVPGGRPAVCGSPSSASSTTSWACGPGRPSPCCARTPDYPEVLRRLGRASDGRARARARVVVEHPGGGVLGSVRRAQHRPDVARDRGPGPRAARWRRWRHCGRRHPGERPAGRGHRAGPAGHARGRRGGASAAARGDGRRSRATWPPCRPTSTPAGCGSAIRRSPLGAPLSVRLGPHLLGQVFDGLLRPLSQAPVWLTRIPWADGDGRAPLALLAAR